jgi:UDP-N-acetylmuramoyl-tripeptide--D-alanyl-D-alanine ligase
MKLSAEQIYQLYKKHPFITTDSRNVEEGCIFFALKGDKFNGNQFAAEALKSGAAYCVIDETPLIDDSCFLQVENVLESLQQLATIHRSHLKIQVIGITGSNGKTTTKELTGAVLSQKFNTFITQGNFNNHIGVPLSVLSINEATEIAVIEMGANHQGEIAALCNIAQPDFGIITNIGKAHLEGFGGYQGVIKAKTELYQFIDATGGKLFVNHDDDLLMEKSSGIARITYGNHQGTAIGAIIAKYPALAIEIMIEGRKLNVASNLAGSYNFYNMMAAATIGNYFGVETEKIVAGLESYTPENNRSQWMDTGKNKIIMDAYNANPTSMMAAIGDFTHSPYKNKVVILGDMLELGEAAEDEHRKVVEMVMKSGFDAVFLVGNNFRHVAESYAVKTFINVLDAKNYLKTSGIQGCTILIKGSRGIALEKLPEVL